MPSSTTYAINIFMLILNLVVAPLFNFSVIQYRRDIEISITAAKECMDKIIDSRELSDTNLEYTANYFATTNSMVEYSIERYAMTINLVPEDKALYRGETYQRYTYTTDNRKYAQGDEVRIHVEMKDRPMFATLASIFMGLEIPLDNMTFAAIVR